MVESRPKWTKDLMISLKSAWEWIIAGEDDRITDSDMNIVKNRHLIGRGDSHPISQAEPCCVYRCLNTYHAFIVKLKNLETLKGCKRDRVIAIEWKSNSTVVRSNGHPIGRHVLYNLQYLNYF
ncbi:hypothetical protein Hdeb2414_s0013g00404771 [Helianthus debilis subsp. tardiflorus]